MAVYLKLYRNNNVVPFQQVDDEMRVHFGAEPDAENWFRNWYNAFGLTLALFPDFARLRGLYEDSPEALEVIDWLAQNFTLDTHWGR